MIPGQLLLICEPQDFSAGKAFVESVISGWTDGRPPYLRFIEPSELVDLEGEYATIDAAWYFVGPATSRANMYSTLDLLEPWHIPTLLTRPDERKAAGDSYTEGITIAPINADTETLQLVLQTSLCHGRMVRHLKLELAVTRRLQNGLQGQIDKLDEEMRMAAKIQRQFMPNRLPSLDGVNFDVLFRPAGYVSGDIYDVRQLDADHVGFYVADAVGHGVPAAFVTVLIKQRLLSQFVGNAEKQIVQPDEALAELNAVMLQNQTTSVQFATACYGTYNMRTRQLQLARAGHPAPLLFKSEQETTKLEPEGPLLGIFESENFDLLETTLDPGDRLVIYSDGFETAFGCAKKPLDGDYIGELSELRHGTPCDAVNKLRQRLDCQAGSLHQRDDLTALVVDIPRQAA